MDFSTFSLADLDAMMQGSLVSHLGIKMTAAAPQKVSARMPVDERSIQPFKLLHGGATLALAETLGSLASYLYTRGQKQVLGTDIHGQHLRSTAGPWVEGTAEPVYLGKRRQIWEVSVRDHEQRLLSVVRVTNTLIEHPTNTP